MHAVHALAKGSDPSVPRSHKSTLRCLQSVTNQVSRLAAERRPDTAWRSLSVRLQQPRRQAGDVPR